MNSRNWRPHHDFSVIRIDPVNSHSAAAVNKLFRLTENNILIREHPCVLIDSGDIYANSIRRITIVLISILTYKERVCLLEVVIPHDF